MNPGGPQQFNLQVIESSFQTNNPALPIVGLDVLADVRVTIKWNDTGVALSTIQIDTGDPTKDGVTYDQPEWQSPGAGPFDLYEQVMGGNLRKVGTVRWSLKAKTLVKTQSNPAARKTRVAVTPTIQLIRTIERIGAAPEASVIYTASPGGPQYGNWV